jgi:peptide/nickel transport system permease protein
VTTAASPIAPRPVVVADAAGRAQPAVRHGLGRFVRSSPLGAAALACLLVIGCVALAAPAIAPYNPVTNNYALAQQPPSATHLLGTDNLGRDVLSRIMYGLRVSLLVSVCSVALAVSIGLVWAVTSGYAGGAYDMASQRVVEVLTAFPTLILAMLLSVGLGPGLGTVIIAVGVTQIPLAMRVTRSVVLSHKNAQFVEAARCVGASPTRIMLRQVAPQCLAPVLVVATLNLGTAVFAEAALSFLGVGVPPPTASLGNMLGGVLAQSFRPPWWLVVFPGAMIALTVLAANLLGDGVRDYLDPRIR